MVDFSVADTDDYRTAQRMVEAFHYSHRPAAAVRMVGTFKIDGRMVAACFFSEPPTRWSEPVMELSRLVRDPAFQDVSLTSLISRSLKAVAQRRDLPQLCVSFADATQGHHGGVYQAASWNYAAYRQPGCEGFLIDGAFVPRRSAYSQFGTSSVPKIVALCESLGSHVVPRYDDGKFLYWKAAGRDGLRVAKALELQALPYPKPSSESGRLRALLIRLGYMGVDDRDTDPVTLCETVLAA